MRHLLMNRFSPLHNRHRFDTATLIQAATTAAAAAAAAAPTLREREITEARPRLPRLPCMYFFATKISRSRRLRKKVRPQQALFHISSHQALLADYVGVSSHVSRQLVSVCLLLQAQVQVREREPRVNNYSLRSRLRQCCQRHSLQHNGRQYQLYPLSSI